jgi:hypothetical protein
MVCACGTSPVCLVIWSVWFIWFIRLVWFNQINKTNQTNQTDRTDQMEQDRLADVFSILLEINPRRCIDNKGTQC